MTSNIRKALAVVAGTLLLSASVFFATSQVSENTTNLDTVCTKVNAVVHYLDSLVERTTANADRPAVQVADPEVQKLIDQGRKANEEFKAFAAAQSKKARCRV